MSNLLSGTKYDSGKRRYDLVDFDAVDGMVDVLTFGADKYEDRNWEQGIAWSRVFGACMRHLTQWWMSKIRGDKGLDPETGLSHLDHAACCIHFLSTYEKREMWEYDDRPER